MLKSELKDVIKECIIEEQISEDTAEDYIYESCILALEADAETDNGVRLAVNQIQDIVNSIQDDKDRINNAKEKLMDVMKKAKGAREINGKLVSDNPVGKRIIAAANAAINKIKSTITAKVEK